jgi:hypothetical protein
MICLRNGPTFSGKHALFNISNISSWALGGSLSRTPARAVCICLVLQSLLASTSWVLREDPVPVMSAAVSQMGFAAGGQPEPSQTGRPLSFVHCQTSDI